MKHYTPPSSCLLCEWTFVARFVVSHWQITTPYDVLQFIDVLHPHHQKILHPFGPSTSFYREHSPSLDICWPLRPYYIWKSAEKSSTNLPLDRLILLAGHGCIDCMLILVLSGTSSAKNNKISFHFLLSSFIVLANTLTQLSCCQRVCSHCTYCTAASFLIHFRANSIDSIKSICPFQTPKVWQCFHRNAVYDLI